MKGSKLVVLASVSALLAGCYYDKPRTDFQSADRARRLMAMAAGEAARIEAPPKRLRQLLSFANMQIESRHYSDARETLKGAWKTTESAAPEALDEHTRVAGWVSMSELSRKAGDRATAGRACDEAVKLLRRIQPPPRRCEYVRGLADELRELRGKGPSARLLREADKWAAAIKDRADRQEALKAIASDLFACDDYEGGGAMLALDNDAAWRAETLKALAHEAVPAKAYGRPLSYFKFFAVSKAK
ncbi:MAG: hypothetical protein ACYTF6_07180 [Planctomycetota bacterium]|jgi:hypothetical protein